MAAPRAANLNPPPAKFKSQRVLGGRLPKFGYAFESMGADVVVRIVEKYLADYRDVFSDEDRLDELMACLNLFVSAGWPAAQSLTFRLAEIWR